MTFGAPVSAGVSVVGRTEALVWLGAILGGRFLSLALKAVFRRDRPPLAHRLVTETTYSYPSGHSVFAAVYFTMLAVVVARLLPPRLTWLKWQSVALCLTLAVLVGLSRVWLGVHYPTDVIGGLILGFGWVFTVATLRRAPGPTGEGGRAVRRWIADGRWLIGAARRGRR